MRKRHTLEEVTVHVLQLTSGNGPERQRQTDRQIDTTREKNLHVASAPDRYSLLLPLSYILFSSVMSAMCLTLPAETSASGCHKLTSDLTFFCQFSIWCVEQLNYISPGIIHVNFTYTADHSHAIQVCKSFNFTSDVHRLWWLSQKESKRKFLIKLKLWFSVASAWQVQ